MYNYSPRFLCLLLWPWCFDFHDVFTLAATETVTQTDTMAAVPNDIGVSVQYEHLNTII